MTWNYEEEYFTAIETKPLGGLIQTGYSSLGMNCIAFGEKL